MNAPRKGTRWPASGWVEGGEYVADGDAENTDFEIKMPVLAFATGADRDAALRDLRAMAALREGEAGLEWWPGRRPGWHAWAPADNHTYAHDPADALLRNTERPRVRMPFAGRGLRSCATGPGKETRAMTEPKWMAELRAKAEAAKAKAPPPWEKIEKHLTDMEAPTFIAAKGADRDKWGEYPHVMDGPFSVRGYDSCTIVDDESDAEVVEYIAAASPDVILHMVTLIEDLMDRVEMIERDVLERYERGPNGSQEDR